MPSGKRVGAHSVVKSDIPETEGSTALEASSLASNAVVTLRVVPGSVLPMSSRGQNSGGLMSSAGLVRYFDSEDRNALKIDPKTVVAFGVLFGVLVQLLNAMG